MAQSSRGAHEQPFVGRSRRPNRNAAQRREQANRATARFVNWVLRVASMTHRGVTVDESWRSWQRGSEGPQGMLPVSRPRGPLSSSGSVRGKSVLKRSGWQICTDKERTRRGSAWSRTNRGGTVGAGAEMRGARAAAHGSGAYRSGAGEVR